MGLAAVLLLLLLRRRHEALHRTLHQPVPRHQHANGQDVHFRGIRPPIADPTRLSDRNQCPGG